MSANVRWALSRHWDALGEAGAAEGHARDGLRHVPNHPELSIQLGWLLLARDAVDEALQVGATDQPGAPRRSPRAPAAGVLRRATSAATPARESLARAPIKRDGAPGEPNVVRHGKLHRWRHAGPPGATPSRGASRRSRVKGDSCRVECQIAGRTARRLRAIASVARCLLHRSRSAHRHPRQCPARSAPMVEPAGTLVPERKVVARSCRSSEPAVRRVLVPHGLPGRPTLEAACLGPLAPGRLAQRAHAQPSVRHGLVLDHESGRQGFPLRPSGALLP